MQILIFVIIAALSSSLEANDSSPKPPPESDCSSLKESNTAELWKKADCYFKKEKYKDSGIYLSKISTLDPKDVDAFALSSYVLWEQANMNTGEKKDELLEKAQEELNRASVLNPKHWKVFLEIGDYHYLRMKAPERAFRFYGMARELYEGNEEQKVPPASAGKKASIENRIARTNEELDRRGEAVSASCLALHWDPDNVEALGRLGRLSGSCKRKNFRAHITGKEKK